VNLGTGISRGAVDTFPGILRYWPRIRRAGLDEPIAHVDAIPGADRLSVMHEGVLQQAGTPGENYNQPANEFVAGFVGELPMSFIDVRLERAGVA